MARGELAVDSDNHDALQILGNIRFIRGDFFAALNFYRRVLSVRKDRADIFNVANTFFQLKKYRQSMVWAKKAVAFDDAFFDAWVLLGQSQMALIKMRRRLIV